MLSFRRAARFGALLLVAAAAVGCREAESITTYETPRTGPRAEPYDVAQMRAAMDHMLVAIVPQGDAAWFFKLVAHGDAVEELREPFEAFVSSVEVREKGEKPAWTLPAGWIEKPGTQMRAATIEIPVRGQTAELAVSTLPLTGDWDAYLTSNVNRWLNQLQQDDLPAKTIAGIAKPLPTKNSKATVLELVGEMAKPSGAMPPGHPPIAEGGSGAPRPDAAAAPPVAATPRPGLGPMGGAVAPATEFAKPAEFTYDAPADWQPGATSSMRKAALIVAKDEQRAEVTVMPFPANAAMSDPIAQAERWAGQAGLSLSADELKALVREVQISGAAGQQIALLGEGGDKPVGILAAMVPQGDQVWFFKMTGDRALVESQGEAFAKFLESVKFAK